MQLIFPGFEEVCQHVRRPWGSYGRGLKTVFIDRYRRRKRVR